MDTMDTRTGLHSLEERRDTKILCQTAKVKRPEEHPMHEKMMSNPTKGRLKRASFVHQSRMLERKDPEVMDHMTKPIPTHSALPPWRIGQFPKVKDSVPDVLKKGTRTEAERKALTLEHIEQQLKKKPTTGHMPTQTALLKRQHETGAEESC